MREVVQLSIQSFTTLELIRIYDADKYFSAVWILRQSTDNQRQMVQRIQDLKIKKNR